MEFDWTKLTIGEWREYLTRVPRANYLQSLPYARAVGTEDRKLTRLALLRRGGEAIGMVAIQEIKIGPIHVLHLYRGPLWFTESPPDEYLAEFARLFDKTFPRRFLRRRRWIPEWKDSASAQELLKREGFRPKAQSYETVWLNLAEDESTLRSNMKQKWRNALNKGERAGLTVSAEWKGATANAFLRHYDLDRKTKRYSGRGCRFVKEEITVAKAFREALILWAVKEEQTVAGILVLMHGHSASYRVGWTTPTGRQCNAHNLLLWEAVKAMKARGVRYFDLGGVEPTNAEGLTHFKQGLGGESFKTPGLFC